jgi:hypothetical protein
LRLASRLRHGGPIRPVGVCAVVLTALVGLVLGGCKDLTGSPGLPAGTPNPTFFNTPTGALGMDAAALGAAQIALQQYVIDAGLLSDELEDDDVNASPGALLQNNGVVSDPLDERILPELPTSSVLDGSLSYVALQNVRAYAAQALGQLATYDTAAAAQKTQQALRGELYALTGYAEIMLADLFCSGVPLSSYIYQHDFTYAGSSTTQQVYQAAIAQFDTALTLAQASDSSQIVYLAAVGKGRALLDLGQYAAAAQAVAQVPQSFQYQLDFEYFTYKTHRFDLTGTAPTTVSNTEGGNGLPYLSNGDPRTAVDTIMTGSFGFPLTFPTRLGGFQATTPSPLTLADGVEATLIQAEAALQATPHTSPTGTDVTWLALLNQLRATAPIPGTMTPNPTALPPLTDPGAQSSNPDSARVALLFRERAYWLFVTGHRQGDLRRLLREYRSIWPSQAQVYPVGPYTAPGRGTYGSDVNAPIPPQELVNPKFHGCLDRDP